MRRKTPMTTITCPDCRGLGYQLWTKRPGNPRGTDCKRCKRLGYVRVKAEWVK